MMKLREKRVEINDGCQGKMIFSILQSIFAGIIMHLPGLVVKWPFEDWAQYFQSLIGATLEGISAAIYNKRIFLWILYVQDYLQELFTIN